MLPFKNSSMIPRACPWTNLRVTLQFFEYNLYNTVSSRIFYNLLWHSISRFEYHLWTRHSVTNIFIYRCYHDCGRLWRTFGISWRFRIVDYQESTGLCFLQAVSVFPSHCSSDTVPPWAASCCPWTGVAVPSLVKCRSSEVTCSICRVALTFLSS